MKEVVFSKHSLEQLEDRGATQEEIKIAIQIGERMSVEKGRIAFRKNFIFNSIWKGKYYKIKQVMPIVKEDINQDIIITVYVFYFGGE
ncbi:MAG: hypothetical protein ABH873_02060 [Candidatus Firestonebacteria bacterium]